MSSGFNFLVLIFNFFIFILWNASGTGGQGDTRRTCGTTAAAGKAKAAKVAKVYMHACHRLVTDPRNLQKAYIHIPRSLTYMISPFLQLSLGGAIGGTFHQST